MTFDYNIGLQLKSFSTAQRSVLLLGCLQWWRAPWPLNHLLQRVLIEFAKPVHWHAVQIKIVADERFRLTPTAKRFGDSTSVDGWVFCHEVKLDARHPVLSRQVEELAIGQHASVQHRIAGGIHHTTVFVHLLNKPQFRILIVIQNADCLIIPLYLRAFDVHWGMNKNIFVLINLLDWFRKHWKNLQSCWSSFVGSRARPGTGFRTRSSSPRSNHSCQLRQSNSVLSNVSKARKLAQEPSGIFPFLQDFGISCDGSMPYCRNKMSSICWLA